MKGKKILTGLLCAAVVGNMVAGVAPGMVCDASAASTQTSTKQKKVVQTTKELEQKRYNGVPGYQYKDIYATERVTIKGINVNEVVIASANPIVTRPMTKPVKFVIYNTTKQETEGEVTVENGKLPDLSLVNNNNYMIYAQDEEYRTPILYIWVKEGKIYNIKKISQGSDNQMIYDYPEVDELRMYKRDPNKVYDKLENDMRVGVSLPVYYKEGTGLLKNVKIKLVSPVETLECNTGEKGRLQTELLEDQNYMVVIENDQWDMDSFPLVAKDKSEYGGGRYAYNHSSCAKVDELRLVDKNETHHSDTILVSKSGDTSVTGINFKDMLLYEKTLSKDLVSELPNKDYEVLDISVVNPHRWERAKLAAGDFAVTRKVPQGKAVKNVYYIDENKQLQKIPFTNEEGKACFTMHSLGIHHVVIEYEVKDPVTEESKNAMVEIFIEAGKKNESDYTAKSWEVYKNAVEAAKKVAKNDGATNAEFQNAIQVVKEAEKALAKAETEKPSNPEKPAKPEVKVASVKLAKTSYAYDGKVKKPVIIAKNNKGGKITSKDYTVKYAAGCKNVGRYTVKVTFKGDYKGTLTKTFDINPKGTSLSKVKVARKSFSATWKKQSKQTSGYQLQYSTNKKFAKAVKISTISKNTTVKKIVKKLSAKKTYYVRVRTYKNVKVGKKTVKLYSGWSKVKAVKTK